MARPKSDNKRDAILAAAVKVFAERGLAAPTAAISSAAGVAEGTLFTYFATKDDLLNALYRAIKLQLAEVLLSGVSRPKDFHGKLRHLWDRYVKWGLSNSDERKVLASLEVSERLTAETKAVGTAPFTELQAMVRQAIAQGDVRELPLDFLSAAMAALAETTMEFISANPGSANLYRSSGFDIFWKGIATN